MGETVTSLLTQQFIEEVQNVLPRRSGLLAGLLCKVGSTVVQVHPVDAPGQQGQHALGRAESYFIPAIEY